jgi:mRNA interferase HicA
MKGNDFIRKIKKLAKQRGKSSHVTLYFGDRRTIVRNPKDELKTGTLIVMLKQLGLSLNDIQDS